MTAMIEVTVGEIAARSMEAVRVLEENGIDYCCGGRRPFEEACRGKGIDARRVLAAIEEGESRQPAEAAGWAEKPAGDLIRHIVDTHHSYLERELPLLENRMAAVAKAHGAQHGELTSELARVFAGLKAELTNHMRKEEMVLFPWVERMETATAAGEPGPALPFGSFCNPIRMMEQEHDEAGQALASLRRLTYGYAPPAEACATWKALYEGLAALERDLHVHIHLENNILFPRAMEMETGR